MQLLTALILGALCTMAIARPRQKRMVGGRLAQRGQFPYLVLVRRPGYECTGSIISPNWVLTAAHCISKANHARIKITAGTVSDWYGGDEKDKYVQHRRVTRAIIHNRYRRFTNDSVDTTFYDIGLLQVNKAFKMTKFVKAVRISQSRPPFTKPCFAVGFGSSDISPEDWDKLKEDPTHTKRFKRSEPLRYYEVGVPQYKLSDYGPMECPKLHDARFKESYQLCSVGGAPNTTHLYVGDSGGPLLCNGQQVGVYALSEPKMYDGSVHIIEVHTAVHSFIDWIKEHVSDLCLATANDVEKTVPVYAEKLNFPYLGVLSTASKDKFPIAAGVSIPERTTQNIKTTGNLRGPTRAKFPTDSLYDSPVVFLELK